MDACQAIARSSLLFVTFVARLMMMGAGCKLKRLDSCAELLKDGFAKHISCYFPYERLRRMAPETWKYMRLLKC